MITNSKIDNLNKIVYNISTLKNLNVKNRFKNESFLF